jgi:hypothetical protein
MIIKIMRKLFAFKITTFCILMVCLLQSCGYILPDPILKERKEKQIGKYVIDMERTEWGEYEAEKDNYKDLTIVFNPNMTFEVSQSVPFLIDTTGQYVIRGRGELCDVYFSSQIQKYGITRYGIWLWPCWVEKQDTITAIITPTPQQNVKRVIPKLYFRKIGYF